MKAPTLQHYDVHVRLKRDSAAYRAYLVRDTLPAGTPAFSLGSNGYPEVHMAERFCRYGVLLPNGLTQLCGWNKSRRTDLLAHIQSAHVKDRRHRPISKSGGLETESIREAGDFYADLMQHENYEGRDMYSQTGKIDDEARSATAATGAAEEENLQEEKSSRTSGYRKPTVQDEDQDDEEIMQDWKPNPEEVVRDSENDAIINGATTNPSDSRRRRASFNSMYGTTPSPGGRRVEAAPVAAPPAGVQTPAIPRDITAEEMDIDLDLQEIELERQAQEANLRLRKLRLQRRKAALSKQRLGDRVLH